MPRTHRPLAKLARTFSELPAIAFRALTMDAGVAAPVRNGDTRGPWFGRSVRVLGAVQVRRLSQSGCAFPDSAPSSPCDFFVHGFTELLGRDDGAMTSAYDQSHDQV